MLTVAIYLSLLNNFRYTNILPYDHTRVELTEPLDGVDYINASWITNAMPRDCNGHILRLNSASESASCSNISFMACQGPLPHTCSHHLQLIHEQKIDIVVMLTRLVEGVGKGNIV